MSDQDSNGAKPTQEATPISYEDFQATFDVTIDRIVAGETFVLIVDGEPSIYMMPYEELCYRTEIEAAIVEADMGNFASDEEVKAAFDEFKSKS